MKTLLVRLAKVVAGAVLVVALLFGWVIGKLGYAHRKARRELNKIKVGMTMNEMVNSFPEGYARGSVSRFARNEACREDSGQVLGSETDDSTSLAPEQEREVTRRCEAETVSILLWRDPGNGQVNTQVTYPKHLPEYKMISKAEFVRLLETEFKGREFSLGFGYDTGTPQHISMRVKVGADGKVKELVQPWGWD